jgi:DNA-binding transcriptional regulator YdaS (Cro superfamily)
MTVKALIDKASEKVGSPHKLASLLGLGSSTVYDWRDGRRTCSPADQARIAAFAGEDALQQLVRATLEQAKGDRRREQLQKVLGKLSHQTGAVIAGVLPSLASLSFLAMTTERYLIRCILC